METLRRTVASATEEVARLWLSASDRLRPDKGSEEGQGLAEYALILGLIAIVAIVSMIFLGDTIAGLFWAPISEDFGKVLSTIL